MYVILGEASNIWERLTTMPNKGYHIEVMAVFYSAMSRMLISICGIMLITYIKLHVIHKEKRLEVFYYLTEMCLCYLITIMIVERRKFQDTDTK